MKSQELGKTVLVTGVSTGIGRATVEALVRAGYRVVGTVRRPEDATGITGAREGRFHPLVLDLTDRASLEAAATKLPDLLPDGKLHALVNNAGVARPGPIQEQPFDEIRHMFEVNVFGLLEWTRLCLPLLGVGKARRVDPGRIINVSSGAGLMGIPYLSGYVASKHALEGLSHSLRRELQPWGIGVVIVGPGNVKTPIWNKVGDGAEYARGLSGNSFVNFLKAMREGEKGGMQAEEIAEVVLRILKSANPRTRYAPMDHKFFTWTIPRMLPEKTVDKMLFKAFGMKEFASGG